MQRELVQNKNVGTTLLQITLLGYKIHQILVREERQDQEKKKIVHIFQERDDAERYLVHLEARPEQPKFGEYKNDNLRIANIDVDIVAANCKQFGYRYTIIEPDALVIPPEL